ncbi:Membrane protein implicated in regulation of membrane protease activity [Actinobaculum suis]|uniref:Activity regulator of membrane protease n=1 Tax=Actinobaculum suis TaxID=1657 RepID=A0A0K9ER51_9ACTO|nr:NfeD family protein [Actinobaculum suis]KMY22653.1 membrane protein [Actinobaculum suis]MDY5153042.1 NfeD family protein [Actinobaculum suis]SDE60928.1 Membrane protein implicated in regulation of membrane protease activity [Actinobaculum suis]VDG76536.1 Putative activity regulator of membrane protease [Actinobaculum suis]
MEWYIWLIGALVAALLELFILDFTFLMLGLAALGTTVVAVFLPTNLTIQVIAFAVLSVLLILTVRPWAQRHMNPKGRAVGNVEANIGRTARALTEINVNGGRVKIGGDEWTGRTDGNAIPAGSTVVVAYIDGATAVVEPLPQNTNPPAPHH